MRPANALTVGVRLIAKFGERPLMPRRALMAARICLALTALFIDLSDVFNGLGQPTLSR